MHHEKRLVPKQLDKKIKSLGDIWFCCEPAMCWFWFLDLITLFLVHLCCVTTFHSKHKNGFLFHNQTKLKATHSIYFFLVYRWSGSHQTRRGWWRVPDGTPILAFHVDLWTWKLIVRCHLKINLHRLHHLCSLSFDCQIWGMNKFNGEKGVVYQHVKQNFACRYNIVIGGQGTLERIRDGAETWRKLRIREERSRFSDANSPLCQNRAFWKFHNAPKAQDCALKDFPVGGPFPC